MAQQTLIMNLDGEVLDGRGCTWSADGGKETSEHQRGVVFTTCRDSNNKITHSLSLDQVSIRTSWKTRPPLEQPSLSELLLNVPQSDGGPGLSGLVKKVTVHTFYLSAASLWANKGACDAGLQTDTVNG